MPTPPLAHLGHWYVSLPVFGGPVVVLAIALKIQTWREARKGPDQTGKRSSVRTAHRDNGKATITVTGPLDYPALLELEVQLGNIAQRAPEILLDLRQLTAADEEAASDLCDVIGRAHAGNRITASILDSPAMHSLRTTCAAEGITLIDHAITG